MFKKYEKVSNEELINLVIAKEEDAITELFDRFKPISTKLAKNIYYKFRNSTIVDINDLTNAGLVNLLRAAKSFNEEKNKNFTGYWYRIARNAMLKLVKDNSLSYQSKNTLKFVSIDTNDSDLLGFKEDDAANIMRNEMIDFLKRHSNDFNDNDIEIFKMYLDGHSVANISKSLGISYSKLNYKIEKIKSKIAELLIHS